MFYNIFKLFGIDQDYLNDHLPTLYFQVIRYNVLIYLTFLRKILAHLTSSLKFVTREMFYSLLGRRYVGTLNQIVVTNGRLLFLRWRVLEYFTVDGYLGCPSP